MQQNLEKAEWIQQVLQEYEGPLLRYAMTFTRDAALAQDVVQDTFLKLCKEDQAKIEGYVAPWLFRVCRNRALEKLRKDKRMTPMEESHERTLQSKDADPARRSEQKEMQEDLSAVIATLPANQQEVVRLKFQNGLSYKEISTITALSVSNVGYLLHHAVRALREALRQDWDITPEAKRSLS